MDNNYITNNTIFDNNKNGDALKVNNVEENQNLNSIKSYKCSDCCVSFMTPTVVSNCVYCNSSNIAEITGSEMSNLNYLPFTKTMVDAKNDYKKNVKSKLFIPFKFRGKKSISNIKKIYIPVSLNSCNVNGQVLFFGLDNDKNDSRVESKKYELCYRVDINFKNVMSSYFSKFDENKLGDVANYSYSSLSLYDKNILNGCSCIIDDISETDNQNNYTNKVNSYVISSVRDSVGHDLKKLKENKTTINNSSSQKVLVPIFLLNLKHKKKSCIYIMNGQSGKSNIDVGLSIFNIVLFSIIIFMILFLILFLIAMFI